MKQVKFPTGDPEKRILFLERVVARLVRRTGSKRSAVLTPYPISTCVSGDDVRGDILKYMFPCEGKIKSGTVFFEKKPKEEVLIGMSLIGPDGGEAKTMITSKRLNLVQVDVATSQGDRLKVSINTQSDEPFPNEVWISLLWVPLIQSSEIKNFIIEDLGDTVDLLEE